MNPNNNRPFARASLFFSRLWLTCESKAGISACLGLLLAALLSGCGQECPVSAELKFNDLGMPFLLQFSNLTDGKITVEKVVVNGNENLTKYMVGLFEKAGQVPVELSTGEFASFLVFPYSSKRKIVTAVP